MGITITKVTSFVLILILMLYSLLTLHHFRSAISSKCKIHVKNETVYSSSDNWCNIYKELRDFISQVQGKNIFVYHYSPLIYFLCDIRNSTSYDTYKPIYNTPEQLNRIIEELKLYSPQYIIKDNYIEMIKNPYSPLYWFFPKVDRLKLNDDPVDDFIRQNYTIEKNLGMFLVLKRNQ